MAGIVFFEAAELGLPVLEAAMEASEFVHPFARQTVRTQVGAGAFAAGVNKLTSGPDHKRKSMVKTRSHTKNELAALRTIAAQNDLMKTQTQMRTFVPTSFKKRKRFDKLSDPGIWQTRRQVENVILTGNTNAATYTVSYIGRNSDLLNLMDDDLKRLVAVMTSNMLIILPHLWLHFLLFCSLRSDRFCI